MTAPRAPKRIRHVKPIWPKMKVHWPHATHEGQPHCLVKPGMYGPLSLSSVADEVTCMRCKVKARVSNVPTN